MSIVVVSRIGDVGIDIADAAVASGTDWLEDVTSARERTGLARLTETAREAAVARLWTLKEAYVKMLGIGIADVSEIAFDLSNDRLLSGGSNDGLTQPVFQTWVVNNRGHRHSVALAMSEPGASSAPVMRCSSEASRVHSRSKLELFAERTAERAASLASVFRTTGAEAA
jgi:4'-phosphopantetheinyl transferase